jgi:hypothetical protein
VAGAAVVPGAAVVSGAAVVVPSPPVPGWVVAVSVPASPAHAAVTRAITVRIAKMLARLLTFSSSSVDVAAADGTRILNRLDGSPP